MSYIPNLILGSPVIFCQVNGMTDLQIISVVITAASVVIALSYYILNIRNLNQTRQAQLFMQIHSQWNDREFVEQFMDLLNLWEWRDLSDSWARSRQFFPLKMEDVGEDDPRTDED